MSKKRMFSQQITGSDAFIEMPLSSQALYFHLSLEADDDGFVNSPKRIQRVIGANDDDLKLLIAKNFIIAFDSGVIVIKHWKINNYIRTDRYTETVYLEEKAMLSVKENGAYTIGMTSGIPDGRQVVYPDKTNIDKNNISSSRVDFLEMLTNEEIAYLKTLYENVYGLLDEAGDDATKKKKTINSPFSYIIGYAENKGWVTKC